MIRTAIGIDVGGTAIKAGVVTAVGEVLARESVPTQADRGPQCVIAQMADIVNRLRLIATANSNSLEGVGVGVPGTVSHRLGTVHSPPNLPGWKNVPVSDLLSRATALRVVLDNDANCATRGEQVCGAGRDAPNVVLLTFGTGVGGGIILNGRLYRGADDAAGEWGHTIVRHGGRLCGCGQRGCLEAYASASNTVARAIERIKEGDRSLLSPRLDRGESITTEDIVAAAGEGDPLAEEIWAETCSYIAVACINIQHALSPNRIILAGGMSAAGPRWLDRVQAAVAETASKMISKPPDIRLAQLGNDAGFIGAALNVFQGD